MRFDSDDGAAAPRETFQVEPRPAADVDHVGAVGGP